MEYDLYSMLETKNVKLSVSIQPVWAKFLSQYKETHQVKTKSQVIEQALQLLQERELEQSYEKAMQEYKESGDKELFDNVVGDGLKHESW